MRKHPAAFGMPPFVDQLVEVATVVSVEIFEVGEEVTEL